MQKTTPAEYIAAKLDALRQTGRFADVVRSADIDIERLMQPPRSPLCVLHHNGGELLSADNEIWSMQLGVTILIRSNADNEGGHAHARMDELTEVVINTLHLSRDDDAIMCVYESQEAAAALSEKSEVMMKTLIFAYSIDRTLPEEA